MLLKIFRNRHASSEKKSTRLNNPKCKQNKKKRIKVLKDKKVKVKVKVMKQELVLLDLEAVVPALLGPVQRL